MTTASGDARRKFEFGRHETFTIREGWLSKGLARMSWSQANGGTGFKADLETADSLGLGSRMVKSLQYWMEASGIAAVTKSGKDKAVLASPLGDALLARDPYLEFPVTWWILHVVLSRREGTVINWFLNDWHERTFERSACIDAFSRHVRERAANQTTEAVIQRDVACLLASYAAHSANERPDPEDATTCPLRDLGLLVRHSDTGRFERTRPLDRIPVEAFLACASLVAADMETDGVALGDLLRERNSPGRVLGMDGDMIDEMASLASETYPGRVGISLLGATRTLTLPRLSPESWLELHFSRIGAAR